MVAEHPPHYFGVWSQESLPLLGGLAGLSQTVNDLGLAERVSEDYWGLLLTKG